ncbi:MAG: crtD [Mycobacterium sp.]|nr:crtD [Mycobacterium sp.]MCW2744713.1 crtD [Mycobacterium sp.]
MRTVPGPTDHVVVIGAGLAGLSAALRLAGAGRRVTVLEREDTPGGRNGLLEVDGYRFDTGPTVLTMPDLIADALDCVGEELADWLDLVPVDPLYRAFYPDGSSLDVLADPAAMAEEVRRVCGGAEAAGYLRYVDFVSKLYRYEMADFIDRNIDSPFDLLTPNLARLAALGGFRRLAPKVNSYLSDPRTQRVLSFQAMYAGLSPQDALAIYAVIAYMDSVAGVYFPKGGMHAVPRALAGAAEKHGVELRYGTTVERLEVRGGRAVAAICADGTRVAGDAFVVNPDLPLAYRQLLPPELTPRRVARQSYSPSCFLLLAGSSAHYSRTAHHTIHFGRAWERTFDEIIKKGQLQSDPSFLVSTPTKSDPGLAPDGKAAYYVLVPTPNLDADLDWSVLGPRYRDEVVHRLEAAGYVGFGDAIEVEDVTTPADWRARGMAAGAPFAAAHSFFQTGPFRAANLPRTVDGVVFAGSGTVPGVGVPMVLLSGRLAAERILGPDRGYRSRALPH